MVYEVQNCPTKVEPGSTAESPALIANSTSGTRPAQ